MINKMIVKNICVDVQIYLAPDFFAKDVALLQLRKGVGDKNNSRYTEEEFVKEIEEGNVIVAMLRDDPIGYAIFNKGKVVECYVEWGFRDSKLEGELKEFTF